MKTPWRRQRQEKHRAKARDKRKQLAAARAVVEARAKGRCERCGNAISAKRPSWHPQRQHLNHRVPKSLGGTNDATNLELVCQACHMPGGQHAPTKERMDTLQASEDFFKSVKSHER